MLLSSIDAYEFERAPLRAAFTDSLRAGGAYRLERVLRAPALARLIHGLPVAPDVSVYMREPRR